MFITKGEKLRDIVSEFEIKFLDSNEIDDDINREYIYGISFSEAQKIKKWLLAIQHELPVIIANGDFNMSVGEMKRLMEKYPNDYEIAVEIKRKDNSVEWLLPPHSHRYMRFNLTEKA